MARPLRRSALPALALIAMLPVVALAYSVNSEVTEPCHENITLDTLSRLRSEHGLAPWLEPSGDDRALVDDLPLAAKTDLAGATLLLANRDVDLNGNAPDDLDVMAMVHGSPEHQKTHCLRAPGDDEPDGSAKALAACRSVIRGQAEKALAGLSADGSVNPDQRTTFKAVLDFRGPVNAALPTLYVEMGRALHTFQDAFSHQWRTSDHLRATTVLNYSDVINEHHEESRDGPPHSAKLDECKGLDSYRAARLKVAKTASLQLAAAILAPAADDSERMARVDAVLDTYLRLQPGCTYANSWCDAPETKYRDPTGCACSAATPGATPWGISPVVLGAALLFARRRRRISVVAALAFSATLPLFASRAIAQEESREPRPEEPPSPPPPAASPAPKDQPAPATKAVPEARPDAVCRSGASPVDTSPDSESREEPFPLGVYLAGGGSLTHAAAAASLGARYRLSPRFLVGVDGELNPWFSRTTKRFRAGTTNVYATLVVRFPMDYERFNVRSTLQLGISRMNFALYGVPKGTVGPYVGFNLVGIEVELGRSLYLVFDPAHIAIPIPQTSGVPFSYPQYRVTLGLQYGA